MGLTGSSSHAPSLPPQIAAKVAAPLSRVDEIVVLSGESGNVTSEVNRLLAEIPASVRAITGVDLTKVSRAPAAAAASRGAGICPPLFRFEAAPSRSPAPSCGPNASLFPSCRSP